jgi:hypothetical protein
MSGASSPRPAYGRVDGGLWFSLQLTPDRAEELYEWSLDGAFGGLIKAGARIAPISRTALRYALDTVKLDTFGADIFFVPEAFSRFGGDWDANGAWLDRRVAGQELEMHGYQ